MRQVSRSALVAQPAARMYALINDIERYPEFIPWCTHAVVRERTATEIVASLTVKRGLLRAQFTTRNILEPEHAIHMQLVEGPFRVLLGEWTLTPIVAPAAALPGTVVPGTAAGNVAAAVTGCRVALEMRFEFSNGLAARLFEPLFEETAGTLVDAFVARARQME